MVYFPGDALLVRRPVPLVLEDGRQPGLLRRRQLLLQRWQHQMLRLQDGGGDKLFCYILANFFFSQIRLQIFFFIKVCEKRNWWGVCLKKGQRAKAVWRQPVAY